MLLSTTDLMRSYRDSCPTESCGYGSLDSFCQKLEHRCPVRRATHELYCLLATAVCMYSEPLLDQTLRRCLAESLRFPAGCVSGQSVARTEAGEGLSNPSSEMATITALDLPNTLRHFPAGAGDQILCSRQGFSTKCERLLENKLRDVYLPRICARQLVNWKLSEFLSVVIDKVSATLFVKLFFTSSEDTIADSYTLSELFCVSSPQEPHQINQHQRQQEVEQTTVATAAAALNTDGSNSYRESYNQQGQYRKSHQHQQSNLESSTTSTQRLCRMHASGAKPPVGESSCAVCAARHFLQQHLGRIARDPENLAKLEHTLRDCMQLQARWCKSLQWIAANVKESRLPEFVRPLVNTCCSDDGCTRSVTVNPQIIITTEGRRVSAKSKWDKKSSS